MPTEETGPPRQHAFVILGSEIRVELVKLIGDAAIKEDEDVSFSDLRNQMDSSIDPGQLNYHLNRLLGQFVERTDEGYDLHSAGTHLYKMLRTGGFERQIEECTLDAEIDCHYCQATVEARFFHGGAIIECTDCGYRYLGYPIDDIASIPGLVEDEPSAFDQLSNYLHHEILGYARGICRTCGLELGAELIDPAEAPGSKTEWKKVYVHRWCNHCGSKLYLFLGVALLANTDLLEFCYDHQVDVLSTPFWQLDFAATDRYVTVHSKDPWEVSLCVTYGGETLELVVDGDFEVLERNYRYQSGDTSKSQVTRRAGNGSNHRPTTGAGMLRAASGMLEVDDPSLPDNANCLQHLRRERWPDGVRCPYCDSADTIKKGRTSKEAKRYRCHDCARTFNDLTRTIFAGRNLQVPEMCYIVATRDESSTAQIARDLDRSYQAVLDFVHEIREFQADGFDDDTDA